MLTIRTIEDVRRIRDEHLISEQIVAEIEQFFKMLSESLTGEPDGWKTYDITPDGPILVMQPGIDDPNVMNVYGMTAQNHGLFGSMIEFTSKIRLDGVELFKTVLVLDNSFCLVIYSEVGKFGEEFDQYLTEYLDE